MTCVDGVQLTGFLPVYSACKNSRKSCDMGGHCILLRILYEKTQNMEMACSSGTRIVWYPLGTNVKTPYASRVPDLSRTKLLSLGIILLTCKDLQYRILGRVPIRQGQDLQGH